MKKLVTIGQVAVYTEAVLPKTAPMDLYQTPCEETEIAFAFLLSCEPQLRAHRAGGFNGHAVNSHPWRILDIGCGEGVWGQVARERWPQCVLHGVDIRPISRPPGYDRLSVIDIRDWDKRYRGEAYDICLGNPPYSNGMAEACVRIGLNHLREGGFLLMLLPLTFITGSRRKNGLYSEHNLKYFGVYSRRISWYGTSRKTPPRDHAIFIIEKGYKGAFTGYLLGNEKRSDGTI